MVCPLKSIEIEGGTKWLDPLVEDFKGRFRALLGMSFRILDPTLALQILKPKIDFSEVET